MSGGVEVVASCVGLEVSTEVFSVGALGWVLVALGAVSTEGDGLSDGTFCCSSVSMSAAGFVIFAGILGSKRGPIMNRPTNRRAIGTPTHLLATPRGVNLLATTHYDAGVGRWYRLRVPQDVYSGEIELDVTILEAGGPDGLGPFPLLSLTGASEKRTFETVVLENEWLTAAFVPDLGGRLISLVEKRSGEDVLLTGLSFTSTGPRGVHAFGGLELTLDGEPRMNALGSVRSLADEDGVWFCESVAGSGLMYHVHASLDESVVRLSLYVRNRTLKPVAWNPGLIWDPTINATSLGGAAYTLNQDRGIGFALVPDKHFSAPGSGRFTYFDEPRLLAPRWGTAIELLILPLIGTGTPVAMTEHATLSKSGEQLVVSSNRELVGAKLVLRTAEGQTMEAPADLSPSSPLKYTLDELRGMPTSFAILGPDRSELLRYPLKATKALEAVEPKDYSGLTDELEALDLDPTTRYWAAHLRTRQAFVDRDYSAAEHHAESALLYNGDDPLAWVEKAVAARLSGDENLDSPDLPNAHFLAPLEPLLRAEGYLAQSGLDGKSFLAPLEANPNDLIEVACFYIGNRLFEDAARFIDAALTVSPLPILRLLYAYCCIATGTLLTDAAAAVATVRGLEPPYPWREIEREALEALCNTFPTEVVLRQYLTCFAG